VFLICLGALVFALSHIWFGWAQVLAKIPLSAIATLAALISGGVAAAIFAHVAYNCFVVYRGQRYSHKTPEWKVVQQIRDAARHHMTRL
jgi:membrane protease YdiL (CAAX protease family)